MLSIAPLASCDPYCAQAVISVAVRSAIGPRTDCAMCWRAC